MPKVKMFLAIAFIILIVGFLYRSYDLGNDSYWIDESYTVLASKNIGEHGSPKFDSGVKYISSFPHTYMLFFIGELLGYDHAPMRLLSVFFGSIFILLIYFLVKSQFDEKIALMSAFLAALSYIEIAWSRQARVYIILQFFLFLSLWLYTIILKKFEVKYLALLLLSILLSFALHPAGFLMPVIILLHYILVKRTRAMDSIMKHVRDIRMSPWMLVMLLFMLSVIIYFVINALMRYGVVANYVDRYANFLFFNYYIFIFLGVIGLFAYKKHFRFNLLYFIMFVSVFVGATFFIDDLNFRYIFIVIPIIYIYSVQGIMYFYGLFNNRVYKYLVSAAVLSLIIFSGFFFFPKNSYALEYGTPQPPFRDAYDYVRAHISTGDMLIVTQPAVSELYLRKADYWLAIGYEKKGIAHLYDQETGQERYTGIQTIADIGEFENALMGDGYIVIDDMGIDRLDPGMKSLVLNLTLEQSYGDTFWSRVYVYRFGEN